MAVAWDGAPLMRLFKRAAEPAEDPYVTARLVEIAARCKTEASLYEAVARAKRSYDEQLSGGFGEAPQDDAA